MRKPFGMAEANCGANPTAASESKPTRADFGFMCPTFFATRETEIGGGSCGNNQT
jgi:hypothetical protein